MKTLRYVLPIMLLLVISCSSPRFNLRLESGRPLASPNYVLKSIGEEEMLITFWFTAFTTVKDKDGTIIHIPHTLAMDEEVSLPKETVKVTMTVEVYNPNHVEYMLIYDFNSKIKGKKSIDQRSGTAAVSDLLYRLHTLDLPFSKDLVRSTMIGKIYSGDSALFMLGPFQYKRGGDREVQVGKNHN